jgi:hypothetical protein
MDHEEKNNPLTDHHLLDLCNIILESESLDKVNALQVQKLYYELESQYIEENMKLQRKIWQLEKEVEIIELNKKHETSLSLFSEELDKLRKKIDALPEQLQAFDSRVEALEHTRRR